MAEIRYTMAFAFDVVIFIAAEILCVLYMSYNYQTVKSYYSVDQQNSEVDSNSKLNVENIDSGINDRVRDNSN